MMNSQPQGENNNTNRNNSNKRDLLTIDDMVAGVLAGDRTILGRVITYIESQRTEHQILAQELLTQLMPHTGKSIRIGITGVPGAGKSTFIETLGTMLTADFDKRVAVLAVDPSSGVTGGSILGDKTRMVHLGADANAFIRPSPSAGTLGGVASKSRETMLVCEAAGYDVVLVETVGVGQSETVVADMTDLFMGLMLPGAGDELQGIKRGLLELVDIIVVNKADGNNAEAASNSARDYRTAMHYVRGGGGGDSASEPGVFTCSALEGTGISEVWSALTDRFDDLNNSGKLEIKRNEQMLTWMRALVDEQVKLLLENHAGVSAIKAKLEAEVLAGQLPAPVAARMIIKAFTGNNDE